MDRSPRKLTAVSPANAGEITEPTQLLLSDQEKRVLELYDQLQQLQLEIALINAHNNYDPGECLTHYDYANRITADTTSSDREEPQSLEEAQEALLQTRAKYVLRNEVAESVLSVKPVLQAVHAGSKASPIERYVQ